MREIIQRSSARVLLIRPLRMRRADRLKISGAVMISLVPRQDQSNKATMLIVAPLRCVLSFALPVRCAGCGTIIGETRSLCAECWTALRFLNGAGCARCGVPMEVPGLVCAPCMARPPSHDGVRAAVAYGGVASDIAIRLKHGRRVGLADVMASAMARHVPEDADFLVPVPLHRWRIWSRGFNQSQLVAKRLSQLSGKPAISDLLERKKRTPPLGGLGAAERAKALKGAVAVSRHKRLLARDRHIALIDDVHTSGATANACAAALKRAGAARVTVICWARVLRDD